MEKFCMALIVIGLIVNCQLALAQEVDAPSIPEAVKIATGEGSVDEMKEKAKEMAEEIKPDLKPSPIKVPQDVINRMMKAQRQMVTLQKEMEIIKVKLEGLNLARQSEFWLFLSAKGVAREELQMWTLAKGIATRN